MKCKFFGIYGKVFFYTLVILLFAICVTVIFFANQIGLVVERAQQEQISNFLTPLSDELTGKSDVEAASIAEAFHAKNSYLEFSFVSQDGVVLYQTEEFVEITLDDDALGTGVRFFEQQNTSIQAGRYRTTVGDGDGKLHLVMVTSDGGRLYISGDLSGTEVYAEFIERTAIALGLILMVSVIGAALFARRIAKPIRQIANDTKRMAGLQPVPAPQVRNDEIGSLAADVYSMYEALQSSIGQLETEIAREREMEENQRYFFSAASHELKTPIAAMSALVEEMLEGMVNAEDYPDSLRKCMKMIATQKKLVSEILEIVRLSGDTVIVNRRDIGLWEVVDTVLLPVKSLSGAKGIELHMDIPDEYVFRSDKKMLERVFSNIFMNAVQNTPEQGAIRIWAESRDDDVLFCVSNKGEQIDEEMMSKLFEPFFRLDNARSRGSGHSGLGLTFVKRTLDRLEIPFSLENTEDGVLFWMRLPKK